MKRLIYQKDAWLSYTLNVTRSNNINNWWNKQAKHNKIHIWWSAKYFVKFKSKWAICWLVIYHANEKRWSKYKNKKIVWDICIET